MESNSSSFLVDTGPPAKAAEDQVTKPALKRLSYSLDSACAVQSRAAYFSFRRQIFHFRSFLITVVSSAHLEASGTE